MLHAGAALVKLSEQEYSGALSHFIKILLNKKYSLPSKVIESVAGHFSRFGMDERKMPVLWHQALLVFVENYSSCLPPNTKEDFRELLKVQFHHQITPEIRKYLFPNS